MTLQLPKIYRKVLKNLAPDVLVEKFFRTRSKHDFMEILAVGKAAVSMSLGAKRGLGEKFRRGFLLTKYDHLDSSSRAVLAAGFELHEAGHPAPDKAGLKATDRLLEWLQEGEGDLLVLMSGGASALLVAPRAPLLLDDLRTLNASLLRSGLAIERMNILRKHLSRVKGGQLVESCARYRTIHQLVLSDICAPELGEKEVLSLVGSGCLVADPSTVEEAREVLDRLQLPEGVASRVASALRETPKAVRGESHILACHHDLREAARKLLGDPITDPRWPEVVVGEVGMVARGFARVGRALREEGRRGVLVASGEPTVAIRVENPGRGGRCQELALRFAREIAGCPGLRLLAGSSDGTDGPTEDAGALVDGTSWPELCRVLGEDEMERVLREHDSGSALSRLKGALLHTGPTGHNINDLYLLEIS
ncbi:MAG: DUF4147 domain-containing protein [Vulcanimicrobiota bacterium]